MSDTSGAQGGQGGVPGGEGPAAPWGADPAATWNIGEGEAAKPWYDFLPDGDVKTTIAGKKYANPVALAQSYHELQRTASHANDANTLIIPGENATDADWNSFYEKWGRPADVSGYDGVNWGETPDETMVGFGKTLAHDLGLNVDQAQRLADNWNAFVAKANGEAEGKTAEANAEEVNALKRDWKGDWNADMAAGNRVLGAIKGQGVSEDDIMAVENAIGIAPMIKIIAAIGKLSGEAGFVAPTGGQGGQDPANMSPEQATAEVERLNGDAEFQKQYTDAKHPSHKAAVERMSALYAKAGNKLQI